MTAAPLRRAAHRYEVRAVWLESAGYCCSQPVQYFDVASLNARAPNNFAVYEIGGGHVEDYAERGAAQVHADQLNGCAL